MIERFGLFPNDKRSNFCEGKVAPYYIKGFFTFLEIHIITNKVTMGRKGLRAKPIR